MTVRAGGILVAVIGLLLGLRSALLLAGRGRPRRGPRPALVLAGPYLRMRNPLFAGALLVMVGAALGARSRALAVLAVVVAIGAHFWVVRVEEPSLRTRFGKAYAAYTERVSRWLPRLVASHAEDVTSKAPAQIGIRPTE